MTSLFNFLNRKGLNDGTPERLAAIYSVAEAEQNGESVEIALGADWDDATKARFLDAVVAWAFLNGYQCYRSARSNSPLPRLQFDRVQRVAVVEGV